VERFLRRIKSLKMATSKIAVRVMKTPREWNAVFHEFLISHKFTQSRFDPCLYVKREDKEFILATIYVGRKRTKGTKKLP